MPNSNAASSLMRGGSEPSVTRAIASAREGKKLHQLTVHHKDHNHNNNPADGSNWELLCIYCHDDEHSRHEVADAYDGAASGKKEERPGFNPFAGLEDLLKDKK